LRESRFEVSLGKKIHDQWLGVVAHTCHLSYVRGQPRQKKLGDVVVPACHPSYSGQYKQENHSPGQPGKK
jgi:hypothetical protein